MCPPGRTFNMTQCENGSAVLVCSNAGGGFGDWRDRWAANGIAELAEAARLGIGGATAIRADTDGCVA